MRVALPFSTTKCHSPRLPESTNASEVSGIRGRSFVGSRPATSRPSRSSTVNVQPSGSKRYVPTSPGQPAGGTSCAGGSRVTTDKCDATILQVGPSRLYVFVTR
jgi:hypothetical protein